MDRPVDVAAPMVEIGAVFAETASAEAAAAALIAAGTPRSDIVSSLEVPETGPGHEAPFIWRLVWIIVLWSVAGGIVGAALGAGLAITVGPEGTSGLILQVVSWIIMGHLVVGMVAGYVVLADRTHPEMPPDRPLTVIKVRVPESDAARLAQTLADHGAREVEVMGPARVGPLR